MFQRRNDNLVAAVSVYNKTLFNILVVRYEWKFILKPIISVRAKAYLTYRLQPVYNRFYIVNIYMTVI